MRRERDPITLADMAQDRETLDELEEIWLELGSWNTVAPEERERWLARVGELVAVQHRRLKAQFAERYGERP